MTSRPLCALFFSALLAASQHLSASEAPTTASLRLINVIDRPTPAEVFIDNKPAREQGFPTAFQTEWLSFGPGSYTIRGSHSDIDSTTQQLSLTAGDSKAWILYLSTSAPQEKDKKPEIVAKSILLDCPRLRQESARPTVTFLSVAAAPVALTIAETTLSVKPLTPTSIPLPQGDSLTISALLSPPSASDSSDTKPASGEKVARELGAIETDQPGNHYVILYNRPDGRPALITFQR